MIDNYDEILNLENDKLRFDKAIENLEKEYTHAVHKKNTDQETKILTEMERYKKIVFEIENKLIDKRTAVQSLENELKAIEDRSLFIDSRDIFSKNKDSNVFQSHLKNTNEENFENHKYKNDENKIYDNIDNSLNDLNDNIDLLMPTFNPEDREHLEIKNKYIPPSSSLYRKTHNNIAFK
jgi:hypothetical protein